MAQMESKFTIIVLIVLIGILSVVLGVMFGRLTHQFSAKATTNEQIETSNNDVSKEEVVEMTVETVDDVLYKTYLMISIDRNVVLHNKKVLDKYGYKSSITQTERNDKRVYSLVLDGEYSKPEAQLLGEEIQDKFPTYWLEEVGNELAENDLIDFEEVLEEAVTEEPEPEEKQPQVVENTVPKKEEIVDNGPKFRIQLLANTDKKSIEAKQDVLKNYGYDTIISSTERDGVTFYRLRLDGSYTEQAGKQLGNKIKSEFSFIEGFWLDKVK